MSRKLKIFVVVSVLLNVLLIGVVAGHAYHRYGFRPEEPIVAVLKRASLPEETRAALMEKLRTAFPKKKGMEDRRRWQEETLAILTAEKFDAAAYRAQLEKMPMHREARHKQMTDLMVEIASALNQDDRRTLAEMLRKASRRFPPRAF